MAKGKVQVRLIAGRTGYGRAGDVVDYPEDEARKHRALGLVAILGEEPVEPPVEQPAEQSDEPEEVADDTTEGKPKKLTQRGRRKA